jgi:cytidine deaminase
VISDLFGAEAAVTMADLQGNFETMKVSDLLPLPFNRSFLY